MLQDIFQTLWRRSRPDVSQCNIGIKHPQAVPINKHRELFWDVLFNVHLRKAVMHFTTHFLTSYSVEITAHFSFHIFLELAIKMITEIK